MRSGEKSLSTEETGLIAVSIDSTGLVEPALSGMRHRLSRAWLWLACVLGPLLLFVPALHAEEAPGPYDAEVPVQGQGVAEREDALRRALAEVLTRLTGDDGEALEQAPFSGLLQEPSRYVQQYRYLAPEEGVSVEDGQRLWVRFDGPALEQEIRAAGIPGRERGQSQVLVWLVVHEGDRPRLIAAHSTADVAARLDEAARRCGLPLLWPSMEWGDQEWAEAIWRGELEAVLDASTRYQPEAVLIGRMDETGPGRWSARWSLNQPGLAEEWTVRGGLDEVVASGVDGAAVMLATRPAAGAGILRQVGVILQVSGIDTLEEYARTLRYLEGLGQVAQVQVVQAEDSGITFRLDVHGGRPVLERAIAQGDTLEAIVVAPGRAGMRTDTVLEGGQGTSTVLAYRLLP